MTPAPVLVVVTDFEHARETLLERIEAVCRRARDGSVAVQLRDRALAARKRFELGKKLRVITHRTSQFLIVNDRIDLALVLQADGVHLTETSVTAAEARQLAPHAWISRAAHEPTVLADGADALVLAPIFEARHGRVALGVDALSKCTAPVYALGGVDATNARRALDAGAQGVAVMGAIRDGERPDELLSALGILR